MVDLKKITDDEIVELIKQGVVTNAELTDAGICPTCFDNEHGNVLFGDISDKILYEDDDIECFLVGNPRAAGHVAVSTKKHYKDMMEIDDIICQKVFLFAKKAMIILREVYGAESVYLCTMCDGPMNHFHIQLIPRYDFEKRGSKNFVKPRQGYVYDEEKVSALRLRLK
jgi:diadenosine tetraphosphate (Ap4A) HIT family hydrolase